MIRANRKELLNRLLAVRPGATSQETFTQSNHVLFRKGRLYTFCQEIACSMESTLPVDFYGAVELPALIDLLDYLPEEEVELDIQENVLLVKGKGRKAKFSMPEDISLPIEDVKLPKQEDWKPLGSFFTEAADLTHRCTMKKDSVFAKQCVHVTPDYLEGSDGIRVLRYTTPTFVKVPILVRGQSLKAMVAFGMTLAAETEDWLHFRNPLRLRLSVRKFELESYPPFDEFLNLRGQSVVFPKGLPEAAKGAGQFAGEDGCIQITVKKKLLIIEGRRPGGEYTEARSLKYDGPDMEFTVPPKLISEVMSMNNEVELTDASIRVDGGRYVYCATLK